MDKIFIHLTPAYEPDEQDEYIPSCEHCGYPAAFNIEGDNVCEDCFLQMCESDFEAYTDAEKAECLERWNADSFEDLSLADKAEEFGYILGEIEYPSDDEDWGEECWEYVPVSR